MPLHIRNAPTGLMKELGYGEGYQYDPETESGVADQQYLPDELVGKLELNEIFRVGNTKTARS